MSDRTRGAVRTGTREGAGVAEVAEGGAADEGHRSPSGGATAVGDGPASANGPEPAPVGGTAPVGAPLVAPAGAPSGAPSGQARPDAPVDNATVRVAGGPVRPSGAPGGAPAANSAPRPADPAGKARGPAGRGRGPRRARLQLRHIDTWSALKISLVVSIALFFVWMVAVGVLFGVLNGLGVFDTLNDLFGQLGSVSGGDVPAEGGSEVITAGVVFGGAAVIGVINILLMTALCTVGAVVYNLCADLVGGVEVTLSERD